MIVSTQEDYVDSRLRHRWELADDGTVTVTDSKGGTVTSPPTDATVALAGQIVAANQAAAVEATIDAKVDASLASLATFQTQVTAARTTIANLKATAATKKTTATATTAEIRSLYAGVETVCGQLDALVAAADSFTRAAAVALRLTAGRLDSTTGT